jgi:hypothetical protein
VAVRVVTVLRVVGTDPEEVAWEPGVRAGVALVMEGTCAIMWLVWFKMELAEADSI